MQLGHDKSSLGLSNSATFLSFLDKKDKDEPVMTVEEDAADYEV